jgi:predicted DNA-binding transcriptional regulator AlpA
MLTVDETLRLLGIGRTKLFLLMKEGRIEPANRNPLLKRPRALRFRRADVEALLRQPE